MSAHLDILNRLSAWELDHYLRGGGVLPSVGFDHRRERIAEARRIGQYGQVGPVAVRALERERKDSAA